MIKNLSYLLLLTSIMFSIDSISMLGIKIYDSRKSVEDLNLPIVGQEPGIVKYRTKNGNDLSVTFENDKVVYMENDWLYTPEGVKPLFSDFTFGETSLVDIRKEYGTNGFTYVNRNVLTTDTHLISFNCFEFDSEKNEILVVVTGLNIDDKEVKENNISEKMLLMAIMIADKAYLDRIWGEEKVYDGDYKKIKP